jgi:hypothetical protein
MKVVGRVVRTGATLITVREVGAKENMLIYGRGNGDLEVGNIYEFSHLLVKNHETWTIYYKKN